MVADANPSAAPGKVKTKNDTVREFTDLLDPALRPTRAQIEKAVAFSIGQRIQRLPSREHRNQP